MQRPIRFVFGLVLAGLLLGGLLSACGGGSGATAPGVAGPNFKLFVTDAPFPGEMVESATIVIREVRVRDVEGGGWQTVFEGESSIDLVPLTGGIVTLLTELDLQPGTYDEIRLIVDAGEVVLDAEALVAGGSHVFNESNGGLHFPSGAQTGIKVKLDTPIVVVTDLSAEVTLDFDLAKNFVFNGSPDVRPGVRRVIFTPVARAVNSTTAGSVGVDFLSDGGTPDDDTDDAPLASASVRVLDAAGEEAASGVTDDLGRMVVQLPPAVYTMEVEAANHETTTTEAFEVFLGNRTELGGVLVAATAGEVTGIVMSDGATDLDEDDDIVLVAASVTLTLQGETDPAAVTTTDANGAFRFESLPIGTYDMVVTAAGHADGSATGVMPTLGGTDVPVVLVAHTRNVTGTISDSDAAGLEGATVVVENAAGVEIGSTTTGSDGSYAMSLPTGAHQITITDPVSGASVSQALTVVGTDPETDQVLDVQLDTAGA